MTRPQVPRFTAPNTPRLKEPDAENVRREHARRIVELQATPGAQLQVVTGITLEDGVETPVAHQLGRPPQWVRESCVRGASTVGLVEEVRDGAFDPAKYVVLKASGFGATITCSLAVL